MMDASESDIDNFVCTALGRNTETQSSRIISKLRNCIPSKLPSHLPFALLQVSPLQPSIKYKINSDTHVCCVGHVPNHRRKGNDVRKGDPSSSRRPSEILGSMDVHVCGRIVNDCARGKVRKDRRKSLLAYLTKAGSIDRAELM